MIIFYVQDSKQQTAVTKVPIDYDVILMQKKCIPIIK